MKKIICFTALIGLAHVASSRNLFLVAVKYKAGTSLLFSTTNFRIFKAAGVNLNSPALSSTGTIVDSYGFKNRPQSGIYLKSNTDLPFLAICSPKKLSDKKVAENSWNLGVINNAPNKVKALTHYLGKREKKNPVQQVQLNVLDKAFYLSKNSRKSMAWLKNYWRRDTIKTASDTVKIRASAQRMTGLSLYRRPDLTQSQN